MVFLHGSTTTDINNMIAFENWNHHNYMQFYWEMCDFLDAEYGNKGVSWYRGKRPETRVIIDCRN